MNARTILVPIDFSSLTEPLMKCATLLARGWDASLLLVHVHPTPVVPAGDDDVYDSQEPNLKERLERILPEGTGIACEHHFAHGDPASAILHLAQTKHVDLIVIGGHGATHHRKQVLGTVARAVMDKAPCPVLTLTAAQREAKARA
jgi:nucleotide-binding universal stress UspA family protein